MVHNGLHANDAAPATSLIWLIMPVVWLACAPICEAQAKQLMVSEIAAHSGLAIDENAAKFREVLYSSRSWAEISGQKYGICFGGCPDVNLKTPIFGSHYELINGRGAIVQDGWEDQTPLSARYPHPEQRVQRAVGHGNYSSASLPAELLRPSHTLTLLGVRHLLGTVAYVIQSDPPDAIPLTSNAMARCAGAVRGTLLIDTETFFPIQYEIEVIRPNICAPADLGGKGNYTNIVGTRARVQFTRATGRDKCGEMHQIYVNAHSEWIAKFNQESFRMGIGEISERDFQSPLKISNGTVRSVWENGDFKVFVTGACLTTEPVEFVTTTISYDTNHPPQ